MLFLGDVSHAKEFLYFIDPVQGLDVKVPTERRNLDLHPILVRAWVPSSPIWVRQTKSFSPVGIRIRHPARASPLGHPSIKTFVLEIVFRVKGVDELFLIEDLCKEVGVVVMVGMVVDVGVVIGKEIVVVEVVDEDYLMVVEVVEKDCSMNIRARLGTIGKASIIKFER